MNWFPFLAGAFTLGCWFMPDPKTPSITGLPWPVLNAILLIESMGLFAMAFFGKP